MPTNKTLEEFLEKVVSYKAKVETELLAAGAHLRYLEDSRVAFIAQIDTLRQLMDSEELPEVEIPIAGEDNIEELFEERLGIEGNPDAEEMRRMRQDGIYTKEAKGIVDQIDEINNE